MDYKRLFKNFFFFCVCFFIFGWGVQWFFNGLINFSEWKINQDKDLFLGSVSDSLEKIEAANDNTQNTEPPYRNWEVQDIEVNSEAAVSVESDLKSPAKVLFKRNELKRLPIASLTKLMTAVVSLENYNLSDRITISKITTMKEDEEGFLITEDTMSVKDLLYMMLIESNNHAAYSLGQATEGNKFVDLMNSKAEEIGLKDTFFIDSTGLSYENYSTAQDLVKLTEYFLRNHYLIAEISRIKEFDLYREDGTLYKKLVNTNKLLSEIPETLGGKTGFTDEAKGCLLLFTKNSKANNFLINVVLGTDDRFSEMKKMIEWVNTAYTWQ